MEDIKSPVPINEKVTEVSSDIVAIDASEIYIDPEKEKKVFHKFDKIFLPQAFVFLLLNYLDRSNVRLSSHHANSH